MTVASDIGEEVVVGALIVGSEDRGAPAVNVTPVLTGEVGEITLVVVSDNNSAETG